MGVRTGGRIQQAACGHPCRGTGEKARVFIAITGRLQAQCGLGLADGGRARTERSVFRVLMPGMRCTA